MTSKPKTKLQMDYQKTCSSSQSKSRVMLNLEKSLLPQTPKYRFVWIPGKSNVPKYNTLRNVDPPIRHTFSSKSCTSINSQKSNNVTRNINDSPNASIMHNKTTHNLLRKNNSVVSLNDDELSQDEVPCTSGEFQTNDIADQLQVNDSLEKLYYDLKNEDNDSCSSYFEIEQDSDPTPDSTEVRYTKLVDGSLQTDVIDMENVTEKKTITPKMTTRENDTCKDDDQFKIAFLNNQKLEIKEINL